MLISQHLQFSEVKLKNKYKRSALFIGRQTINIIAAIAISLLTVSLMYLFNIKIGQNLFFFCVLQVILMFSFLALFLIFFIFFVIFVLFLFFSISVVHTVI